MHAALEKALGAALRGDQLSKPTKPQYPRLRVTLSVRRPDGGMPIRFEYKARTLSRLAAEYDAKKAAREQGLTVWALIDIAEEA